MSHPTCPDSPRPLIAVESDGPQWMNEQTDPEEGGNRVAAVGLTRYERQLPIRQISYYLCGEIREALAYTELFNTLWTAGGADQVYLHLNSPGGDFDTGLQIINNMVASEARVVTVLEARAYSMAAMLFLAGDELIVHDNCQLMFHTYSGSLVGKGNEQQAQVIALGNWFEKVMKRICMPFLSSAEVAKVLQGTDIWMDSDEIRRRLARLNQTSAKTMRSTKRVDTADDKHGPSSPGE
ncbi:Clp protease ClpP [Crenobacter sp. SG2305]|uniref:Clp protease ClpP n=1 Tax=Crenobacter oryzisoli TaxID=3056844 RepID=UPI0025AA476D|nr:Clp protease ClpP [Crenobacter sp. SG2305]MDN0081954.1 Clp protease ClpP [Crenobacter sp. SG2305]